MKITTKSINTHPFWENKQKWIKFLLKILSFKYIFLLPQVNKTMLVSDKFVNFDIIFRNPINYADQQFINKLFNIISNNFFIRKKKILNEIRFKFYLIKKFAKNIKDKKNIIIYEVGAGLGFQAIINSYLLKPSKIIIYDLPVISKIQKRIFSISYVKGIIHRKNKVDYPNKFFFFSSWGFSEMPIMTRKKFEYLIKNKSSYVLIYFQKIFLINNDLTSAIDNMSYFNELKNKMDKKYNVLIKKEISVRSGNHYKFSAIKKIK
jgi:hypothetical protein